MTTAIDDLQAAYVATQAARQEAKTKNTDQANKEDIVDRLVSEGRLERPEPGWLAALASG